MYAYIYIYIYIERERERNTYITNNIYINNDQEMHSNKQRMFKANDNAEDPIDEM